MIVKIGLRSHLVFHYETLKKNTSKIVSSDIMGMILSGNWFCDTPVSIKYLMSPPSTTSLLSKQVWK